MMGELSGICHTVRAGKAENEMVILPFLINFEAKFTCKTEKLINFLGWEIN
jgi:hypothetical protein